MSIDFGIASRLFPACFLVLGRTVLGRGSDVRMIGGWSLLRLPRSSFGWVSSRATATRRGAPRKLEVISMGISMVNVGFRKCRTRGRPKLCQWSLAWTKAGRTSAHCRRPILILIWTGPPTTSNSNNTSNYQDTLPKIPSKLYPPLTWRLTVPQAASTIWKCALESAHAETVEKYWVCQTEGSQANVHITDTLCSSLPVSHQVP